MIKRQFGYQQRALGQISIDREGQFSVSAPCIRPRPPRITLSGKAKGGAGRVLHLVFETALLRAMLKLEAISCG